MGAGRVAGRHVSDGDVEMYRLSAHGVGALEVAGRVGGVRTRVSESRVRTLLQAIERLAQDADPDVMSRISRLHEENPAAAAELARLERGGEVERPRGAVARSRRERAAPGAGTWPADFARVAESIKAVQRDVVAELRHDVRPTGEVLREYLERGKTDLDATPKAGRSRERC